MLSYLLLFLGNTSPAPIAAPKLVLRSENVPTADVSVIFEGLFLMSIFQGTSTLTWISAIVILENTLSVFPENLTILERLSGNSCCSNPNHKTW